MKTGTILTKAYDYCPQADIWGMHWIEEDDVLGRWDFDYDVGASSREIATKIADAIVAKLERDYAKWGIDPSPKVAIIFGDGVAGAEVIYQGARGTMKISARMLIQ